MEYILYILTGAIVGFISGILGVGGGMLIVPILAFIFNYYNISPTYAMHIAIGTSLSIMIFTAIAATVERYRKKDIDFFYIKKMVLFIISGTVLGSCLANIFSSYSLQIVFGIFLALVSIKMIIGFKIIDKKKKKPNTYTMATIGFLIGAKSGLLGIGGGALSIPFFKYCGLSMKKASGISSVFTLAIAVVGSLLFFILGKISNPQINLGYIYWPAFLFIAPLSIIFAPLGVKTGHMVKGDILRKLFGILLIGISLKMLF